MPENPAGTPEERSTSKRRNIISIPILLGGGKQGNVIATGDVVDYFEITGGVDPTANTAYKLMSRNKVVRAKYVDLADTTPQADAGTSGGTDRWYGVPRLSGRRGQRKGRPIRVPTQLKTPKGTIRTATLLFPSGAILAQISNFIATKFTSTAKKPTYFWTDRGTRIAVIAAPQGVDLNPGSEATNTPPAG